MGSIYRFTISQSGSVVKLWSLCWAALSTHLLCLLFCLLIFSHSSNFLVKSVLIVNAESLVMNVVDHGSCVEVRRIDSLQAYT